MVSACMSPQKKNFDDYQEIQATTCAGIGGGLQIRGKGTLQIKIEDDEGRIHLLKIPDSCHIPGLPMVLISPQHWERTAGPAKAIQEVNRCIVKWGRRYMYQKMISSTNRSNTPRAWTAAGSREFHAFCAAVESDEN